LRDLKAEFGRSNDFTKAARAGIGCESLRAEIARSKDRTVLYLTVRHDFYTQILHTFFISQALIKASGHLIFGSKKFARCQAKDTVL
jgi:hypothetical protein